MDRIIREGAVISIYKSEEMESHAR